MAYGAPPQQSPLRTPLYDRHVAADARMVDFAGWLMPIQYRSILGEHEAVRNGVGLFDLSHMGRLYLRGPQATNLAQWVTVNDVGALADGQAQYSLFCNSQGGIMDDVVVYRHDDQYLVVVNAANRDKLVHWLHLQRAERGFEVEMEDATSRLAMIGMQGPAAQHVLQPLADSDLDTMSYYRGRMTRVAGVEAFVARTGYTGEDGFELIVQSESASAIWQRLLELPSTPPVTACGLGARDTLRMEAGMHLYGHEITEWTNPYEAGLGRVVKLDKGEFAGRAALALQAPRPPHLRLVGFQMVDTAVPRQGYPVSREGRQVGTVTSGGFAPTLKMNVGMAYVPIELAEIGCEFEVEVRRRRCRARVVPLPFYAHRTRRKTT